jgi:hypothetical protein
MLNPELKFLYDRYRSELKPLIAEYESRNEDFVTSLLDDLPLMFDNIALYETASGEEKNNYKIAAEQCLDNAIDNLLICLVASMMENIKKFKSRFSKETFELLDGGKFCGKFFQLEREVIAVKNSDLKLAYNKLKEMEDMIEQCHGDTLTSSLKEDSRKMTIAKWLLTIAIALLVNFLILKLL